MAVGGGYRGATRRVQRHYPAGSGTLGGGYDAECKKGATPCGGVAPLLSIVVEQLHGGCGNPVVDARKDTEGGDAEGAEGEGQLGVGVALERGQRLGSLLDVHGLDDEQVVVE